MEIVVVGTGYVGLVAGTCFAEAGNNVTCIDIDKKKIELLRKGETVIYEPGLETLLRKNIKSGRLLFSDELKSCVPFADVIIMAVGTPTGSDGSAELSQVFSAVEQFAPIMEGYTLVVNKCTVPIGTVDNIRIKIKGLVKSGVEFDIASNPEFLKEGLAVQDFMYPDRVIIGVDSIKAEEILKTLYKPFLMSGNPIHVMDVKSAELTKYACNSFLATKISFMNDIAELCEKIGADVKSVRIGMASDHRIGKSFLYSGVGYGGSCFPKDVKAFISIAEQNEVELSIVKATETINKVQKDRFIKKILKYFNNDIKGKHFAVWGLAFKPQTDDVREAPALYIIEELCKHGAIVKASDPVAITNTKANLKYNIEYSEDHLSILDKSDALLILTEWNEYRSCEPQILKKHFHGKVVFDGRNIWEPEEIKKNGYNYYGVGRL